MRQFSQLVSNTMSFSPYLFVDTGATRKSDEHRQHYLHFTAQFEHQKTCVQLKQIFERIQQHMEFTKGYLEGAGYIRRYFFVFDKAVALEITPAGQIIATHNDFDASNVIKPNVVLTKIIPPETKFIREGACNE